MTRCPKKNGSKCKGVLMWRVFVALSEPIPLGLSCSSKSGRTPSSCASRSSLPISRSSPPSLPCWMCNGRRPSIGALVYLSCVCRLMLCVLPCFASPWHLPTSCDHTWCLEYHIHMSVPYSICFVPYTMYHTKYTMTKHTIPGVPFSHTSTVCHLPVYPVPCVRYRIPCTIPGIPCPTYPNRIPYTRVPCTTLDVPYTVHHISHTVYRVPYVRYADKVSICLVPSTIYRI